jgi:hypothetical protein
METNKYVLKKPIEFDGETITEIVLDFDSLESDDILSAERQFKAENKEFVPVLEIAKGYLAHVAARSAKKPVEFIRSLNAKDFSTVTMMAQNFLLG